MDLRNCSTALFVKDIEISKDFYLNILKLEIDLDFGKNVIFKNGFAIWEINTEHLIPWKLGYDKLTDHSVNRFELYFETEDIHVVYEQLKNRNVNFLHEIHEEHWGQKTIRFFDPDNHLIEIGESMSRFIRRFHSQGMTVEQISEKTFVPVDAVKNFLV